jgi:hypothetical protein
MAYVLITGHPRSGSKWLATRLAACEKLGKTFVAHEPRAGMDYHLTKRLLAEGVNPTWFADLNVRIRTLEADAGGRRGIVEVASCARYLALAIAAAATGPTTTVLHLVRDGRKVVPSMLARGHYRPGRPTPSGEFPIAEGKTRHETHVRLWAGAVNVCEPFPPIRLEDLLAGDGGALYTLASLFDPDEWELISKAWDTTPINATKKPGPAYDEWTDIEKGVFWKVCGEAMRQHGYEP